MKMDTSTWKEVTFDNSSIGIMLNHENLYFLNIKIKDLIVFGNNLWSKTQFNKIQEKKG